MDRSAEVLACATGLLGPCELVADLSWRELDLAVVLELQPADQQQPTVVAKGHREEQRFLLEVSAYERWVPSIGDRAPRLLAVDVDHRVIILSKVTASGCPEELSLDAYRDAGGVLRRFHAAAASDGDETWAQGRLENLHGWIERMPGGLIDERDLRWVVDEASALLDLPAPPLVACHGDWQPRNWLLGAGDEIFAIDFERAKLDWWIHDVQRMWWREWVDRPDRRDAFFEGYGRELDATERAGLRARSAAGHVVQVIWATEHGDLSFAADGRANLRRMRQSG